MFLSKITNVININFIRNISWIKFWQILIYSIKGKIKTYILVIIFINMPNIFIIQNLISVVRNNIILKKLFIILVLYKLNGATSINKIYTNFQINIEIISNIALIILANIFIPLFWYKLLGKIFLIIGNCFIA